MKINDTISGFRVISAVSHPELNGTLWKMEHIKTGSRLCWLDNRVENKLFSIHFGTQPWDDTGVFHILEHSVLCGSDKFPVKEPFLDLLKSSMNTFLNAMTFYDKTMYPVSSRNEKDFMNLCEVYLDAVFFPAIYRNPGIFAQEGWHYELHDGEETPTYKGVVFNEMKGAMASVDTLLEEKLCSLLFPDNCYRFNSGGDPAHIPELSREDFLNAHRTLYHPSNAQTFLDGDMPIERVLSLIDSYFSRFDRCPVPDAIPMQAAVPAMDVTLDYEIGKDEDEAGKTQMVMGKILGSWQEKQRQWAANVLASYLTGSNVAPLKRALLASGLVQDAWIAVNAGMAQSYISLRILNTEYEHLDRIKAIIRETCEQILRDGLDREMLEANLNQIEFSLKVTDEPAGIERAIAASNAWLYGGEPEEYLLFNDTLTALREALDTGYYADLLREMMLDDEHMVCLIARPSKTEGDRIRAREAEALAKAAGAWSDDERADVTRANAELEAWQMSEDTPEAHATLPTLALDDVSPTVKPIPTEDTVQKGTRVLFHAIPTNGVVHARFYFSINDLTLDKAADVAFMVDLLGELPTEAYPLIELKKQIKNHFGGLTFSVSPYAMVECPDRCRVFITVGMSVLEKNLSRAVNLVAEILKHTRFDDAAIIREHLLQDMDDAYRDIIDSGSRYAVMRANRHTSAVAALDESMSGYEGYLHMLDFSRHFDERIEAFMQMAKEVSTRVFTPARLTVSETSTSAHGELLDLIERLSDGDPATSRDGRDEPAYFTFTPVTEPLKEAIQIPSGVSYAALADNFCRYGAYFTGGLRLMSGILSYGYLWNEIRVRGGAYGCSFGVTRSGTARFSSYRDPSPLRSLDIYRQASSYIRELAESEESLDGYIISSLSAGDPLLPPAHLGGTADSRLFSGITDDMINQTRRETLALDKKDLLTLCPLFDIMAEQGNVCLVAHEGVIRSLDDTWTVYQL